MTQNVLQHSDILSFFRYARAKVVERGYLWEIEIVALRYFSFLKPIDFLNTYAFVVLNTGMKNQIADKMYQKLFSDGIDSVRHEGKKKAIKDMMAKYDLVFTQLQYCKTDEDKINFLGSLYWIGDITKYHLARNLGIDCCKPDRHLTKLAKIFGFNNVHQMCKFIVDETKDRIGTVDVILWRFCNLYGTDHILDYCVKK